MRHHRRLAPALVGLLLLLAGCGGTPAPSLLSGRACLARLGKEEVSYRPLADVAGPSSSCQVDTAVRVTRIAQRLNRPTVMSCALAVRFDDFEREVVQPLAREELGHRVVRIDHMGGYSCRHIAGTSHLSMHALGLAIDIAGFRLADGSTVSVERDWHDPGPKRTFLHHLARRACQYFSVVLTPDSNAEHHDHIHVDIGRQRLCSA